MNAQRKRSNTSRDARASLSELSPMLATAGSETPAGDDWTFEPKYDGVRVLAIADGRDVALVSRNGLHKTAQFPEIAEAVGALSARARMPLVLDGEIVALVNGAPARFQALQSRMHAIHGVERHRAETPAALIVFDCLLAGSEQLIAEPWTTRRRALERLVPRSRSPHLLLGGTSDDGEEMLREARAGAWEGVIAKRKSSTYRMGVRSRDWLKLKLERRQEFVVGGFTEPRGSRTHIGSLLIGFYEDDELVYAGHVGGGFSHASLAAMATRLSPLVRRTSPFSSTPKTNEPAVWVEPRVVVEVRFNEWTSDGKLRQPIFLGVRDDKDARAVVREPASIMTPAGKARATKPAGKRVSTVASASSASVVSQLDAIQAAGGDGRLDLGREGSLDITSLGKVFFPKAKATKGDLMRYYARVSAAILPAMRDRPLVLKRYPNGVGGPTFYQQRAPDRVPPGVRTEPAADDGESRLVGGSLATLLYTVQLGAISVDPWHARVGSLDTPDYTIIDLDPGEGASFRKVVSVALLVRDELQRYSLNAIPKTSGASGMHVVVPLPKGVDEDSARLLAELVATNVAQRSPKLATVVRSVRARPRGTVYVDFLQNIRGKSVAGVYSVRAQPLATVSTPLQWDEVTPSLDPREFTMDTVVERIATLGDLWGAAIKASNSLKALTGDAPRAGTGATAARTRSARTRKVSHG